MSKGRKHIWESLFALTWVDFRSQLTSAFSCGGLTLQTSHWCHAIAYHTLRNNMNMYMLFSENLSGVSMQFGETATTSVARLQPLDTISIWPEIQQSLFKRAHLTAVFDISSLQAVVFTNTASVSYRFLLSISYDSSAADGSPQHLVSKQWGSFDDSHLELREAPGFVTRNWKGVRWKMVRAQRVIFPSY